MPSLLRAFPTHEAGGPGGKEGPCLTGDGAGSRGCGETVEDPWSRTAFPPRADGWPHGAGRQLDGHRDRAGDPASWAHGTTAVGEGAATPASTALHGAACQQAPIPCGPGEDRAVLPAHAAHAAHGLRAGLPQRESGLYRRVLGHAERARLRAAPRATGSPPPPQSPQETVAAPRPGAPPGQRRARVEGGHRPRPLKGLRSGPLTPACSACLTKEPSLDRPDRNLGRRPWAACLPPPAPGPVTSSISRLPRLSVSLSRPGLSLTTPHDCASKPASINGNSLHGCGRGAAGTREGCASACVVGHLPGKSGPAPSFSSRQGPQAEPMPLPSVKGPHSQGYLDRCFCLKLPVGSGVRISQDARGVHAPCGYAARDGETEGHLVWRLVA